MASAVDALATTVEQDLGKAGMLSLPITLVILVIAFGALAAAGIPLLLALTAVFATFGVVAGTSHVFPMANEAGALVLLIGLAVGVDYSLFYLKREREERAAGRSERAALEAAAATSGRSVLVSGLTVMTAMAGMFLTGDPVFESFAVATIAVVAIAMIGSLTVLPALLSRLGDRVDRGRVPLVGRLRRDNGEGRIWGAIVNGVLRRPLLSAVLAGGLLVALAIPALQMRMVKPGPDTFPQSLPAVQTYERMQQAFPGSALPASVVVKAPDVNSQEMQSAIQRLRQRAVATGRMHEPITVDVNDDGRLRKSPFRSTARAPTPPRTRLSRSCATRSCRRPSARYRTSRPASPVAAAQWKDSTDEMKANLPIVVGFVLLLAFSLMLVAFRSPVIAVKAIVLNLLSVAAAYGVLVLVFQHGYGSDFLGFTPTGGIDPVVPLLLFVILFGLSMDYHVFLLSRIREAVQGGMSTDEAVARGIKSTAGVVTSAAIVMVGVFAVFATLSMLMFKQFGVGLATAILLDATIVRGVLLPASMKLLGDWNWYLPRWLEWLPRFDVSESEPPADPRPAPSPPRPRPIPTPGPDRPGGLTCERNPSMTATTPRQKPLTRSRIVALAIIGLAVLGLAYLRFAPDAGPVSVPKGAHAGDLILESCTYATEDGGYEADCGTLVVPENRADPKSRLIALPVTRIHARSDHPAEPIFRLEGGPGITNTQFKDASRFAADHDVVLVGYRGMDGSVRLDCPEVESALKHSTDLLDETSFRERADAFHACADRLTAEGVDLAGYSLPQRVDDLEAARKALGYDRIDLRERERRDAHGDDLRLALSEEHPPVGDDRRQPARPLPLGCEDDRRADPPLRRALRAGRVLPEPDAGPGRLDPLGLGEHPRAAGCSSRSRKATSRQLRSSASWPRPPTAPDRLRRRGRSTRCSPPSRATAAARGSSP